MSLFGRKLIDSFKTKLPRLSLPVPPYHSTQYWEKVYNQLTANDVYEWGDLSFEQLKKVRYQNVYQDGIRNLYGKEMSSSCKEITEENVNEASKTKSFEDIISVQRNVGSKSILILGCGNSNLGHDVYLHYNDKVENETDMVDIIQCDCSPSVIRSMNERYSNLPHMTIVEADACASPYSKQIRVSKETADRNEDEEKDQDSVVESCKKFPFQSNSIDAVVDKGLVDALFCSEKHLIPRVMMNVHKSLKPKSNFVFFSFSQPEYLLKETVVFNSVWSENMDETNSEENKTIVSHSQLRLWEEIDVCKLKTIYMYRFAKGETEYTEKDGLLVEKGSLPSMHRKLAHNKI